MTSGYTKIVLFADINNPEHFINLLRQLDFSFNSSVGKKQSNVKIFVTLTDKILSVFTGWFVNHYFKFIINVDFDLFLLLKYYITLKLCMITTCY